MSDHGHHIGRVDVPVDSDTVMIAVQARFADGEVLHTSTVVDRDSAGRARAVATETVGRVRTLQLLDGDLVLATITTAPPPRSTPLPSPFEVIEQALVERLVPEAGSSAQHVVDSLERAGYTITDQYWDED
jgi:hypothetical protein